jgi:hypothetical protein
MCADSVSAGLQNSIFTSPLNSPVLSHALWKKAKPLNLLCWSGLLISVSTIVTTNSCTGFITVHPRRCTVLFVSSGVAAS